MPLQYPSDTNHLNIKKLDTKTLQRLETAIAKSEYSQGMRLKVITKVRVKRRAHNDRKLIFLTQVNPSIIGGLIIEIGDRTIDLSVSSKIAKMNKLLLNTL